MKKAGTSTQINISVTGSIVGYWFFVWVLLKNKNNDNDDNNKQQTTNNNNTVSIRPWLGHLVIGKQPNQTANVIVLCTPFQMIIFPPIVQANTTTNANQTPYVLFYCRDFEFEDTGRLLPTFFMVHADLNLMTRGGSVAIYR